MAVHAKAKRFVGHPCCVQAISNVWYGKIDFDRMGYIRLIMNICTFGLFTMLKINCRKNTQKNEVEVSDSRYSAE
jgi:hypothetical protein